MYSLVRFEFTSMFKLSKDYVGNNFLDCFYYTSSLLYLYNIKQQWAHFQIYLFTARNIDFVILNNVFEYFPHILMANVEFYMK